MTTHKTTRISLAQLGELNSLLHDRSVEEILVWAAERFGERWSIASSMGAEDIVLIDHAVKALGAENVRVFTLDTGRLHPETLATIEDVRNHFGIGVTVLFPSREAVEAMVAEKGVFSFRENVTNRKECCGARKLEPLGRALSGLDAWVTGLRRDHVTRSGLGLIELDLLNGGLAKLNPLVEWSRSSIWEYIRGHDLPSNPLHDLGYPSIGCEPCTRPVAPGEDERAGRWWWESAESKECGLHGGKS